MLYYNINQWIKYEKKFVIPNQFESVKLQIILYTFVNNIHITKGQIDLLAHFAINGINSESIKKALKDKIYKSRFSLGNTISILTKEELIIEDSKGIKNINPKLELVTNELLLGNIKVINLNK